MTPYMNHNPSARLITYNNATKQFTNIYTYWIDLNATNAEDKLVFELEYELPSAYNMPDFSPKSWFDLTERMRYDPTLFELWNQHFYTMETNHSCGDLCKRLAICSMQNVGNHEDYNACLL